MMNPKVSVVIPTYNRASVLPRAIRSALNQSMQDFEIIIADDGSSDDTAAAVGQFEDERIRLIRLDQNAGVCAARNAALAEARGEYVAFLDSDDEWDPEKLQAQVERFESNPHGLNDLGVVLGVTARRLYPEFVVRSDVNTEWDGHAEKLIWRYPRHTWSTMLVRRQYLERIGGFDERIRASEFWDLAHRLAKVCQFDATNKSILILHREPGPRNWNPVNQAAAARVLLEKHEFRGRYARKAKAGLHASVARQEALEGKLIPALGSVARAFVSYPDPRLFLTALNLGYRRVTGRSLRRRR